MKSCKVKTAALVLTLLSSPFGFAFGADQSSRSVHSVGDLYFSATAGYQFPIGGAAYPGIEYIFFGFKIADVVPVDFGGGAKLQVGFVTVPIFGYSYLTFGTGLYATAHISTKDIAPGVSWLNDMDFYVSVGPGLNYYLFFGDAAYYLTRDDFTLSFTTFDGVAWYLTDGFAIKVEFAYWGAYVGPTVAVGISVRL